jgi:uncharacterized membrane protein (UPF0127 family)
MIPRFCKPRIFFLLFLCFLSVACSGCFAKDQICFHGQCVAVEIMDDDMERQRGLQDRTQLADNAGMLFVFQEDGYHSFWMKDTKIPLDMLWLDHSRTIVHLEQNAPPCLSSTCLSYTPLKSALYVLELNSGKAKKLGLKMGDQLEFRLGKYLKN